MSRLFALVAMLAVTACSTGPRKVGGQPSWRSASDDAGDDRDSTTAARPPTAAPTTLVLRPRGPGVAAYNDPPRTAAPLSPLGDAIAAEITALAPKAAVPLADGRLYNAAADLAAIIEPEGVLPYPLIEFALQHHGIIEPSPNMLVVWGPIDEPRMIVEHLRPRLAELLIAEPQARFGIGAVDRGGRAAIVVMLQASFVETQPIPRTLATGARAPLVGKVATGFSEPEAYLTGSDGAVRHLALAVGADGSFRGEVTCAAPGRQQLELAASDHTGSTVLANVPMWCGQAAPVELAATIDAEDAAPVTSVAAAEARLLALLNRDRAAAGLPALVSDPAVAAVARAHSQDMHDHDFVGHISPTTGSAADRAEVAGIKTGVVLENIARAYGPAEAQAGLMNSPGHRANVLSTAATHVGIGVVLGDEVAGRRELFLTQMFIRVPPVLDPVAAREIVRAKLVTDDPKLSGDAALDAIAADFAAELARGVPRAQAKVEVSRRLDAQAARFRQAASVVTAVTELDAVVARDLLGDRWADRVGVGLAQGPHPELGPGAYWLVLVLARAR